MAKTSRKTPASKITKLKTDKVASKVAPKGASKPATVSASLVEHRYVPTPGRESPRFSGIKTFFRLPYVSMQDDYDVGIVGVPFDGGASYRPGQRFAPTRVREVSSLGRVFHMGRMTSFTEKMKVADVGDVPTVPIDLKKTYAKIQKFFKQGLALNKRFISVGGDHSITLPILREIRKSVGKPVRFIHFDAHFDTYPAAWDVEYHHGSFARHAVEEKLINPKGSIQIGIRGPLAGGSDLDFTKKHGIRVATMDEIRGKGIEAFVKSLPDFGDDPVYISYDVDCLDPAYAPGTGTPVPGGLSTYEVQQIFRGLKVKNLVGADVVEVNPPYDLSDITSLAALDAIFEMIGLMATSSR
jgi:guanidinopropionase